MCGHIDRENRDVGCAIRFEPCCQIQHVRSVGYGGKPALQGVRQVFCVGPALCDAAFADIGQTIAAWLGLPPLEHGTAMALR